MGGANFLQRNLLKDLIYLGQTKPVGRQTVQGLFRYALESVLDAQTPRAVVFTRLMNTEGIDGVLQRLKFSNLEQYSFDSVTDGENLQKDDIWGETEFLVVLSPRYSAVLLWDYSTEPNKNTSCLYYMLNSKLVNEVIRIISNNSKINLMRYTQEYTPERRDNMLLNTAVHKFINYADSFVEEAAMSQAENKVICATDDIVQKYEYISTKARMLSHDIKNQLSVIDLYSKILEKRLEGENFAENYESVKNSISNIKKAKDSVSVLLSELCTIQHANLNTLGFSKIFESAVNMIEARALEKGVDVKVSNNYQGEVIADENKLLNVFINIIYNAIDAVSENGCIEITTGTTDDGFVKVDITNNGAAIDESIKEKIFDEGYTTKPTGSGLGLFISKNAMKEQYGDLSLSKSDNEGTTFTITIPKV